MHVWQWLLTGLFVAVVSRLVLRGARLTLGAYLALGSLGGLAAGSLLWFANVTSPGTGLLHVLVALAGAVGAIATMQAVMRTTSGAGRLEKADLKPPDLESAVHGLGERERRVLRRFLQRDTIARDANVVDQERTTLGQRAADRIAAFGGSWAFMGLFAASIFAWMLYNAESGKPFDVYPFILLNLVLSCLAAAQAPIILMSQNRQAEKDRIAARLDFEINLKAELEILSLHEKIDGLREKAWQDLLEIQQRQLTLLEKLESARR